jgi:hypothetical protein
MRGIKLATLGCFAAGALLAAPGAQARETFLDLPIKTATESELGKQKLLDVPVYFAGQKHGKIQKDFGVFKTNRRTNAFGKADEEACKIVFLTTMIQLQQRAIAEGGNAVVDVKSITKNNPLESATNYRCVAGNLMANVVLTGRVVKLAK